MELRKYIYQKWRLSWASCFQIRGRKVVEVNIRDIKPANLLKPTDLQKFLQENKPTLGNEKESVELPGFHLNPKQRGNVQDRLTLGVLLLGSEGEISNEGRIDDGNIVKFRLIKVGPMIFTIAILIIASIIAFLLLSGYISFTV